jgi:hypothetical protein
MPQPRSPERIPRPSDITVNAMSKRSLRNVETQKKKRRRAIPRAKISRIQGNTAGVRRRLKKAALKARGAKTAKG